ncbi:hypothetical protein K2P47_00720 [Patescibacteria group bacterium]|nr:hypothetical protein [Patescibacteria group bacterium]
MCTFVPNGNKPIKPEVEEKTIEPQPEQSLANNKQGLNPFPGWRSSDDDKFIVDL